MLSDSLYVIYIDGASSGNPGPSGIGVVIYRNDKKIESISRKIGTATNNIAEYKALITALSYIKKNNIKNFRIYSDSELVVKQINGEYIVRNVILKKLYKEAMGLIKGFNGFEILHITSRENKEANKLAQEKTKKVHQSLVHQSSAIMVYFFTGALVLWCSGALF